MKKQKLLTVFAVVLLSANLVLGQNVVTCEAPFGTINYIPKFTGARVIQNSSIFDNGNVGIGTTAPSARLHINGTTLFGGVATIASGQYIRSASNGGARILGTQGNTAASPAIGFFSTNSIDDGGGGNGIFRPAANTMAFATTSTEWMRILPNGNIGIGITAPSAKLHVNGTAIINGVATFNDATTFNGIVTINSGQYIRSEVNGGARILGAQGNTAASPAIGFFSTNSIDDGAGGNGIFRPAANTMAFATASTEWMRISPGGHVGIGTTTPSYKLDVNGIIRVEDVVISSDKRFKKNIHTIQGALDKILALNGTNYEFKIEEFKNKNFSDGKRYGFIAQELKEVLPELVKEDADGFYAVNYNGVIPILTEAMKEEHKIIQELQNKIEKLEQLLTTALTQSVNDNAFAKDKAELFQNSPNPFSQQTEINYYLADKVSNAAMLIFDMNGKQIKHYDLTVKGNNKVIINSNELSPGMYMYSLIVDNKLVDTKRMILTD